jgi:putative transcriptional regulator
MCYIKRRFILIMYIHKISGNFLIAVPGLDDPNFAHTVVLICEHTKEGAFGLVINKILMTSIAPLLESLGMEKKRFDLPVHYGGPVNPEQGHIIYSPYDKKYDSLIITRDLAMTASKDIIYDIASGTAPARLIFTLGFAGWGPSQLEEELMMGSWLVAPADFDVVFDTPVGERWRAAAGLIGIDFDRYCDLNGNA